tara:strand:+ start:9462 stop:10493 length:1032 start_codon:yes stop_codon:yes gene_type:complete
MSIEQKIATLLAESKAAKLAEQVEAEEIVSEEVDETEVVAEGEMPPALKKAMAKKSKAKGDDEEDDMEDEDEDKDMKKESMKKMAEMSYKKMSKESVDVTIDVSADVDALINGEELSEEFKTKAATIFEAAIVTRVKQEVSRLEEEFEARLEEAVAKNQEGLVEQVDGYLGYVAEQWMAQNELALERGMKAEILEGFVSGLKGLFEEHYIEVPEERFDVLGSMELQIEELEERLNEQVATNIEMSKTLAEAKRTEIIKTVSEGLTVTESEKFNSLAEELSFEDAVSFETKVKTIRENYFSGKTVSGSKIDSVVTDEPVEQLTEQVKPKLDGRMSAYLSALSNK